MTSLHVSRNWLVPFGALDAASPRAAAPYWLDLDREEYAAQLAELKQWVDTVLRPTTADTSYATVGQATSTWIWELSTLAAELHRTYSGKLPDLPGALEFYECWLPGSMRTSANTPGPHRAMQCVAPPALRLGGTMTAVAHDHQGNKPRGGPYPRQLSPVPGLAIRPTPRGPAELSLYRSAMRSRST